MEGQAVYHALKRCRQCKAQVEGAGGEGERADQVGNDRRQGAAQGPQQHAGDRDGYKAEGCGYKLVIKPQEPLGNHSQR